MDTVEKILELLAYRNKTQKELAEYLGINKTVITDWKSGKSKSYKSYICDIAVFLDVPINDIVDNVPVSITRTANREQPVSDSPVQDSTTRELIDKFNKFSLEKKSKVITLVLELENQPD